MHKRAWGLRANWELPRERVNSTTKERRTGVTEQDSANAKGVRFKQGETEYHLLAVQNSLTESELCVVLANGDTLFVAIHPKGGAHLRRSQ